MYYIYDIRFPSKPYIFEDQDKGTQEPAIFDDKEKAIRMCNMMNAVTSLTTFAIAKEG